MVMDLLWLIPLLPALGFVAIGLAGAGIFGAAALFRKLFGDNDSTSTR